jgi:hypothetical protein
VAFRDYLREHPEARDEYRTLKLDLAHRHPRDRAAYQEGKGTFIRRILVRAGVSIAQQSDVVAVNGARLWTALQGRGIPMVLCHGGPGGYDYLAPVAEMVGDDCLVLRYDQRGSGRSEAIVSTSAIPRAVAAPNLARESGIYWETDLAGSRGSV